MPQLPRKRLVSYGFLLLNTLVWGAALIVVKPSLEFTTPFRFLLYRYAFCILFSLPLFMYYLPKIKHLGSALRRISLIELIGTTAALSLLYIGLQHTSGIEASLLVSTTPIFVVLAGVLLLREKQEFHETIGLGLAFIGTILLTVVPALDTYQNGHGISLFGNTLILAQNMLIALYYILAKRWYQKLPKLFVTTISFYVGFISFLVLSLLQLDFSVSQLVQSIIQDFSHPWVWVASIYMALFGSIIGLTAYIKGQDGIEASEASVFTYLQPLVSIPLAFVLLGETVTPLQILALAVIVAGVVLAGWRFTPRRHKKTATQKK